MSHQAILQRHDPLCPAANAPCSCNLCNPYCTCDSLRAAYRRGREDAAKAVEALGAVDVAYGDMTVEVKAAIAAARGDANCAHSRTQYTREVCWCGDAVDVCDDCGVDVHACADGADAGNRNASVPEDATPHAASTNPDSAPRGERGDGERA